MTTWERVCQHPGAPRHLRVRNAGNLGEEATQELLGAFVRQTTDLTAMMQGEVGAWWAKLGRQTTYFDLRSSPSRGVGPVTSVTDTCQRDLVVVLPEGEEAAAIAAEWHRRGVVRFGPEEKPAECLVEAARPPPVRLEVVGLPPTATAEDVAGMFSAVSKGGELVGTPFRQTVGKEWLLPASAFGVTGDAGQERVTMAKGATVWNVDVVLTTFAEGIPRVLFLPIKGESGKFTTWWECEVALAGSEPAGFTWLQACAGCHAYGHSKSSCRRRAWKSDDDGSGWVRVMTSKPRAQATTSRSLGRKEGTASEEPFCGRCLRDGHTRRDCSGDIRCRYCRRPGHIKKDCPTLLAKQKRLESAGNSATPAKSHKRGASGKGRKQPAATPARSASPVIELSSEKAFPSVQQAAVTSASPRRKDRLPRAPRSSPKVLREESKEGEAATTVEVVPLPISPPKEAPRSSRRVVSTSPVEMLVPTSPEGPPPHTPQDRMVTADATSEMLQSHTTEVGSSVPEPCAEVDTPGISGRVVARNEARRQTAGGDASSSPSCGVQVVSSSL